MTRQPDERWIPEETFGDRLRRIRRHLQLSQTDFAGQMGAGVKAVGSWEAGIREPRAAVAIAKRVELAFGVPAAWLLGLETQTAPGPGDGPEGGEGLPRLDSNQQPSGSMYPQVSRLSLVAA